MNNAKDSISHLMEILRSYLDLAIGWLAAGYEILRSHFDFVIEWLVARYAEDPRLYMIVASAMLLIFILLWVLVRWLGKRRSLPLPEAESAAEPVEAEEATPEVAIEEPAVEKVEVAVEEESTVPAAVEEAFEPAEAEVEPEPAEPEKEARVSLFGRLKAGLEKTQEQFIGSLDRILAGRDALDDEIFDELEEALITADVGVRTTQNILEGISKQPITSAGALRKSLKQEIKGILVRDVPAIEIKRASPFIIMVIGVNGVGKTTTIGKLASRLAEEGLSIMMVAADTFRAAAAEQLEIWSERAGADLVKGKSGSDPSAVVYDGLEAALARDVDVVLIDTAGRLHTKGNLMEELKKLKRTVERRVEGAPHEVILVLDSTTGQNAIMQAKQFNEALGVTGIVLTKLDGTAKGGVIVGIVDELDIPIRYIGIGEGVDDLRSFDAAEFVQALFDES